ncbi:hypothetical protein ACFJGV_05840 [Cnuibacter sp. UC19_7]|uniref:hypothetical protein n=1 Tax=Cnuibacter sp. UC19_7 TaxID=3350166 RepID=UPI00366BD210
MSDERSGAAWPPPGFTGDRDTNGAPPEAPQSAPPAWQPQQPASPTESQVWQAQQPTTPMEPQAWQPQPAPPWQQQAPAQPAAAWAPPTLSDPHRPTPDPARRRARRRLLAAILIPTLAVLALAAGFTAWSVLSIQRYSSDTTALQQAADDERLAVAANSARLQDAGSLQLRLEGVTASGSFGRDATAEADALRTSSTALATTVASSPEFSVTPVTVPPPVSDGWRPPWVLDAVSSDMEEAIDSLDTAAANASANDDTVAAAVETTSTAETTYFAALAAAGQATIDAHPLTSYQARFKLTDLMEQATDAAVPTARNGELVDSMAAAQDAVVAAEATELAERADPSLAVRKEIEDYANSISRGLQLDIDWAPEVSGLGEGWLSGTAQYMYDHDGWAIIMLNYPIADAWTDGYNDFDAKAVVTHEVGHTQVLRPECEKIFRGPVFDGDDEVWATAWTIAQGFDTDGSGISAYGRPSDEQIAAAAQCT